MEKRKVGFSILYKLMLALTGLPAVTLGLYFSLATNLFESDKIAYIYDAGVTLSRTMAAQIRVDVENISDRVLPIVESFDPNENKFKGDAKSIFTKIDSIKYISFYRFQSAKEGKKLNELIQDEKFKKTLERYKKNMSYLIHRAYRLGFALAPMGTGSPYLLVAIANPVADAESEQVKDVIFFLAESKQIQGVFAGASTFTSYLVNGSGFVVARPKEDNSAFKKVRKIDIFSGDRWSDVPEGTKEHKMTEEQTYLASYAKVGVEDLMVVSVVQKSTALANLQVLLIKSLLFFVALIAAAIIFSVLASQGLTSKIREIYSATLKVAEGNFNVQLDVRSQDEVGGLARSFNHMTKEIYRLLQETTEKARMESELKTAQAVQETLFPSTRAAFGKVQVSGFYKPASECGGDWWHYCEVGDYLFVWIGDATGHGASAALITSAAKSAAAIIEKLPNISPSLAMSYINTAIHECSKGKMMMTFFIGAIHKQTGEMVYTNASHDPPFVLPGDVRPLKKKHIKTLNKVNGSRLGEAKDAEYPQTIIQINPGDTILFYTDGIPELKDPNGTDMGDRQYIKNVLNAVESTDDVDQFVTNIYEKIEAHRQGAPLNDDVTYFAVKFHDHEVAVSEPDPETGDMLDSVPDMPSDDETVVA